MIILKEDSGTNFIGRFVNQAYPKVVSYVGSVTQLRPTLRKLPDNIPIIVVYDLPTNSAVAISQHNKLVVYQKKFRQDMILFPIVCAECTLYAFLVLHGLRADIPVSLDVNPELAFKDIINKYIQECARPRGKFYREDCSCLCISDLVGKDLFTKSELFFQYGASTTHVNAMAYYMARAQSNCAKLRPPCNHSPMPNTSYIINHEYVSKEILPGIYDVVPK